MDADVIGRKLLMACEPIFDQRVQDHVEGRDDFRNWTITLHHRGRRRDHLHDALVRNCGFDDQP